MVKWLSEQRADNREENKDGTSPLGVDAQYGHLEVAKWPKEQESTWVRRTAMAGLLCITRYATGN
jgi:hypothetical protein